MILEIFYTSLISTLKISLVVLSTIYIVNYFLNKGLLEKISNFLAPITEKLKLNSFLISSIMVSFLSPTVGYTLLSDGIKDNKLTEKEVLFGSLANSFPAVFSHALTYYVPVVIPILGYTGIIYVILRLFIAFVKSIIGILLIKATSGGEKYLKENLKIEKPKNINKKFEKSPFNKTFDFSKRFIPLMFLSMFGVIYLSKMGFFEHFSILILPITSFFNLNPNTGILAITGVINVSAAMVMAGTFLKSSSLTPNEVIIGLLLGNIVAFSTRSVKHSIPLHFSLFGPKRGSKVILLNASLTIILDIFIISFLIIYM
ncbi:nucleoside recognition domain-containing protein [Methanococcus vannielii]|nr:nucleoside recognition domain-containing protein [Methanococcus vannielii]